MEANKETNKETNLEKNNEMLRGKKFVASYSGGKDCILAIHRAVKAGLKPVELITTFNTDAERSWFHGMSEELLRIVSASLGIPVKLVKTSGAEYSDNFEKALSGAKANGAEVCIFGDIDLKGHLEWCSARCEKTGLTPWFPLWNESRKELVYEGIDAGFLSVIKIVDTNRLSEEFLGKVLNRDIVNEIEESGADICGENGEYHTFTFNGPLFSNAIEFSIRGKIKQDKYIFLDIAAP